MQEEKFPRHVAIILDGNGRWAQQRHLSRSEGHKKGGENLRKLIDVILDLNIPYVSLYAFSTENWKRPESEVKFLWKLLEDFFKKYLKECIKKDICIKVSGDISKLPDSSQKVLQKAIHSTSLNRSLIANFCINYGSQQEIVDAINRILDEKLNEYKKNHRYFPVQIEDLEKNLYTYPLPPVDLLIRPGGEYRISNFLLWQSAYAELYFTDVLWPDFTKEDLMKALDWYKKRERRFGGI